MTSVRRIHLFVPGPVPSGSSFPQWVNRPKSADPNDLTLPRGPRPEPDSEALDAGSGFPPDIEAPELVHPEATRHHPIDVFQLDRGVLIVSDRVKKTLASIDAAAFEFVEAPGRFGDGSSAPLMWIADVVRFVDATDEERSDVYVKIITSWRTGRPIKRVSHQGQGAGFFHAAALTNVHVFRPLYSPFSIFFDDTVVAAAEEERWIGFDSWFVGVVD